METELYIEESLQKVNDAVRSLKGELQSISSQIQSHHWAVSSTTEASGGFNEIIPTSDSLLGQQSAAAADVSQSLPSPPPHSSSHNLLETAPTPVVEKDTMRDIQCTEGDSEDVKAAAVVDGEMSIHSYPQDSTHMEDNTVERILSYAVDVEEGTSNASDALEPTANAIVDFVDVCNTEPISGSGQAVNAPSVGTVDVSELVHILLPGADVPTAVTSSSKIDDQMSDKRVSDSSIVINNGDNVGAEDPVAKIASSDAQSCVKDIEVEAPVDVPMAPNALSPSKANPHLVGGWKRDDHELFVKV